MAAFFEHPVATLGGLKSISSFVPVLIANQIPSSASFISISFFCPAEWYRYWHW